MAEGDIRVSGRRDGRPFLIDGVPLHQGLTAEVIMGAVQRRMSTLDDPGFCIACGLEHLGIEPDARRYRCEACGKHGVYGADELLLAIA